MPYAKIALLAQKWTAFEQALTSSIDAQEYHLPEIQKLMTAESVIDLNAHAIYPNTEYVHRLTQHLLELRNKDSSEQTFATLCELWRDVLENRNQKPLKIQHHKRLEGTCFFNFSLQLMEGKSNRFKNIQILDPNNADDFAAAVQEIKYLDCLAHGLNFAELPIMGDTVLTALLKYKETICFLAKTENDQIVGYCWGMMLRNIPAKENKVNVFWIMNMAKNPDFYDPTIKIGTALRHSIAATLKAKMDCHFLGYQHALNHKFHLAIVDGLSNGDEKINLGQEQYEAKSKVDYESFSSGYRRSHLIRVNSNQYPFPENKAVGSANLDALRQAAGNAKDYILGGLLFYGRSYYQQLTGSLLDKPTSHRIEEPVSDSQKTCDTSILQKIIASNQWKQQGTQFFDNCIPKTMEKLQQSIQSLNDYSAIKQCVETCGFALLRSKLTSHFYFAIAKSATPTDAVNRLLESPILPKEWVELIGTERQELIRVPSRLPI